MAGFRASGARRTVPCVICAALAIAGCGSTTAHAGTAVPTSTTSRPGVSADVVVTFCGPELVAGYHVANHGTTAARYRFTIVFEDAAGATVAQGTETTDVLRPGAALEAQVETSRDFTASTLPPVAHCELRNVVRLPA